MHISVIIRTINLEHSQTHATFLDLDIKIEDGLFLSKLFDKRDKCAFLIVRMPRFESNIPLTIFYGSIFSEFLRTTRCKLKLEHCLKRTLFKDAIARGKSKLHQ